MSTQRKWNRVSDHALPEGVELLVWDGSSMAVMSWDPTLRLWLDGWGVRCPRETVTHWRLVDPPEGA